MAEPTEADRERAEAVCVDMPGVDYEDEGESWREKVAYVAQALADERERVRAPFLALAEEYDLIPLDHAEARRIVRKVADRIRRAAEETGQ